MYKPFSFDSLLTLPLALQDYDDSVFGFGQAFGVDTIVLSQIDLFSAKPTGPVFALIQGTDQPETLNGTEDDDVIRGRDGNDTIYGNGGNDQIFGDNDNDTLVGGAGNDVIDGGAGNDILHGNAGVDSFTVSSGTNEIYVDVFDILDGGTITGGTGFDTVYVQLDTGIAGGNRRIIYNIDAASQIDRYVGTDLAETVDASAASTAVFLYGYQGQATANGSVGDILIGSQFNDTIYFSSDVASVRGGDGIDSVFFQQSAAGQNASFDMGVSEIEIATGGSGNDVFDARTQVNDVKIFGGDGNDILLGGMGVSEIHGGNGNDDLRAGTGASQEIFGDAGDDIIIGNYVTLPGSVDIYGGTGTDTLVMTGQSLADYTIEYLTVGFQDFKITNDNGGELDYVTDDVEIFRVNGQSFAINGLQITGLTLTGDAAANTLKGSDANDTINGGDGNDIINARGGGDTIDGGAGNDTITASSSANHSNLITGGSGNDTVTDADYGSSIYLLSGPRANYTVTFDASLGALIVTDNVGTDGTDTLVGMKTLSFAGDDHAATSFAGAIGSTSGETLTGTAGIDTIYGLGGEDILNGAAGNDTLFGGDGDDDLFGDGDDDTLMGGGDDDSLFGGDGNDMLFGGSGHDKLNGGDGDDYLDAGTSGDNPFGRDELRGGNGNDTMIAGTGLNIMIGGSGNDIYDISKTAFSVTITETAGEGTDVLKLGDGINAGNLSLALIGKQGRLSDFYYDLVGTYNGQTLFSVRSESADISTFTGEPLSYIGVETIRFADGSELSVQSITNFTGSAVRVGDGAWTMVGSSGNDTITHTGGSAVRASIVDGLGGNDVIYGLDNNLEILRGGADNDVIFGNGGDDRIEGGTGNDTLYGGAGADTILGDDGDDYLYVDAADTLRGGSGYDTVIVQDLYASGVTIDLGETAIERVLGTNVADTLNASTASAGVTLYGFAGADTLIGSAQTDYLFIDEDDVESGQVDGNGGYDWAYNNSSSAESGAFTVNMAALEIEGYYGTSDADVAEIVDASGVATSVTIYGNGGADQLTGGSGGDYIYVNSGFTSAQGGAGYDYIIYNSFDGSGLTFNLGVNGFEGAVGRGGNDVFDASTVTVSTSLYGAGGNDTLIGGSATDYLYGDAGNDTYTGNAHFDYFLHDNTFGADTITDFTQGEDVMIIRTAGVASMADIVFTQDGADALLTMGANSIRLTGVTAANLVASDFIFAPTSAEAPETGPDQQAAEFTDLEAGISQDVVETSEDAVVYPHVTEADDADSLSFDGNWMWADGFDGSLL